MSYNPYYNEYYDCPTGTVVGDRGIYLGEWEPYDSRERNTGYVLRVYAAPCDIHDGMGNSLSLSFKEAAKKVSELKNWYGHDGSDFNDGYDIICALNGGNHRKLGDWFVPTSEILSGIYAHHGREVNYNSMYLSRNCGALRDSFKAHDGKYWSSSGNIVNKQEAWACDFIAGSAVSLNRETSLLAVRPVRAELVRH